MEDKSPTGLKGNSKNKKTRVEKGKKLYGRAFLLPAGRKFITLIKIILN